MSNTDRQEDARAIEAARERGSITLHEILHLAADSPVDVDEAVELAEQAGLKVVDSEREDAWDDLEKLATEGPDAFRQVREGPAPAEDVQIEDPATFYLREISRTPLLTAEEEVALAKQIEAGRAAQERLEQGVDDEAERDELERQRDTGEAARRRMVESNLRLVVSVAKKYLGRGLSFLDLVQEGNIGLHKGVDRYDWRKGFRFSTYAYWWIRQAVGRAVAEHGRTIRLPAHIFEQLSKLYNTARELQAALGRAPTAQEIGDRMGISAEKVQEAMRAARVPISLDLPVGEDAQSVLGDIVADTAARSPSDVAEEELLASSMDEALQQYLTPREAHLVRMRFGLDRDGRERTLDEVGRELQVSRERARQIEHEALRKLRTAAPFKRQFREYVA